MHIKFLYYIWGLGYFLGGKGSFGSLIVLIRRRLSIYKKAYSVAYDYIILEKGTLGCMEELRNYLWL